MCSVVRTSSTEAYRDSLLHTDLHWLDVSERESCMSSSSWRSTACTVKRLRTSWNSANQLHMSRRGNISNPPPDSSYGRRAFSVAGPSVWNFLSESLCHIRQNGYYTATKVCMAIRTDDRKKIYRVEPPAADKIFCHTMSSDLFAIAKLLVLHCT